MATVGEAFVTLRPDLDKFGGEANRMMANIGGGIAKGAAIAFAAVGVAAVAGFSAAIKKAGDLEQAVANISTIKPTIDATGVFNTLNEMSRRVPQTAEELGAALYNVFSSVDVTADEGLKLVEKFAKGAVGAGTDAETFGTAMLGVMNAYGLAVADADHISDVFFNTVNAGVVTGQELASSLGPVTQSAKNAGVSLDELGALIAGVTKEGGPAAQNINNLNNLLMKINTEQAVNAMKKMGVSTVDAAGDFRPILDVMGDLKAKLGPMTEAQRANAIQDIFPDAQARTGASVILSQLDFVSAALKTNQNEVGSASKAYETMSKTFNSQTKLLGNAFDSILITIGSKVLPAITPMISAFSIWIPEAFAAAEQKMKELQPVFAMIGDTIGAVVDVVKNVASVVIPPLVEAFKFLAENWESTAFAMSVIATKVLIPMFAVWALHAGLAAAATIIALAPVLIPLAAIGVAAFLLHKNWGTAMAGIEKATTAWGAIFSAVGTQVQKILADVGQFFSDAGTKARNALDGMTLAIGSFVSSIGSAIKGFVDDALAVWKMFTENPPRMIGVMIGLVIGGLLNLAQGIGDFVGKTARAFADWVGEVKDIVVEFFTSLPDRIGTWLREAWDNIDTFVRNALQTARTWLSDTGTAVAEFFGSLPGKIWEWLQEMFWKFVAFGDESEAALATTWSDMWTAMSEFFTSLPAKLWQFGIDAINGLIGGIGSMVTKAVESAKSLVGGVIDGIRSALGNPKSPAPATIPLGESIGKGIAQGIKNSTPGVVAAMKDQVSQLSQAAAAASKFIADAQPRIWAQRLRDMTPAGYAKMYAAEVAEQQSIREGRNPESLAEMFALAQKAASSGHVLNALEYAAVPIVANEFGLNFKDAFGGLVGPTTQTGTLPQMPPIIIQLDGKTIATVVGEKTQEQSFLVGGALG